MKKRMTVKAKIVITCVVCVILYGVFNCLHTYERKGEVVESNNQEITVVDELGNLWEVKEKGYKVGDEVVMIMNDKGTTTIYDDEIKGLTK